MKAAIRPSRFLSRYSEQGVVERALGGFIPTSGLQEEHSTSHRSEQNFDFSKTSPDYSQ